ncbi:MAG: hypothetical protein KatS3mg076_3132 [Candidatus Binatia bacterium]|nr:MAG: hypothetical protein KatS3mg076_3132 [Candidatus Binatia bacterium]
MRKLGGDNPDAIYHFARIRGDRTYRVRGRRGLECYFSFTVHGRSPDGKLGMAAEPVLADVNDRALEFREDGSYEIVFGPEPAPGNWVRLDPGAASLIVRHYYELERCAASDPEIRVELEIEALGTPPRRSERDDEVMARRIEDVAAFVRGGSVELLDLTTLPVPFVSRVPNELPEPAAFGASGQAAWGAVDIAYAMAPFRVAPDEALVMTGRLPDCAFANVVLWNRHMQTFEYRDRRVSLNRRQIVPEPDGSYRIVIAHRDPGVPNWLDTDGHSEGTIFWRFLLPREKPPRPECRLVRFEDLER